MKYGKILAMFTAMLLAFVFANEVAAAPRPMNQRDNWQRRNYQQRDYLFEIPDFYKAQNVFFTDGKTGGTFQTYDRENYNFGAYIGGFVLAPGSTPNRPMITGERPGSLNYSRLISGKYSRFEAVIAPSYAWRSVRDQRSVGTCKIFFDGKEVYSRRISKNSATEKISLDLRGVRRIEIQLQGKSLCFFDPFLIK